jgi:hypothetical protein
MNSIDEKKQLSESIQTEEGKNVFLDKFTLHALKKIGFSGNINKINHNLILENISDGKIKFEENETVLEHIIRDSCYNYNPENNNFVEHLRTTASSALDYAQTAMINFYLLFINDKKSMLKDTTTEKKPPKILNCQEVDDFTKTFNKLLLDQIGENNTPWQNENQYPYYTQEPFTGRIFHDANQIGLQLHNAELGFPYINYAPVNIIVNSKPNWLKGLKEKFVNAPICHTVYMGKDEHGNKKYQMTVPTKKLNQNIITESPVLQQPVSGIGLNQNYQLQSENIEQYFTSLMANYLNLAFNKLPLYPQPWTSQDTDRLAKSLENDPMLGLRSSQNAFTNAISKKIPSQFIKQQHSINEKLISDNKFKDHFFITLASIYFDPKTRQAHNNQPEFVKYLDNISKYTVSPTTQGNIIDRLEMFTKSPALLNDMITSYISKTAKNSQKQVQPLNPKLMVHKR